MAGAPACWDESEGGWKQRDEEGRWQKETGRGAGRAESRAWRDSWEMSEDSWVRARSWRDFVQKKECFFTL